MLNIKKQQQQSNSLVKNKSHKYSKKVQNKVQTKFQILW